MSETATRQVKWDDWPLTKKVTWAMGVEAAGKYADANGGRLDREASESDWHSSLYERMQAGIEDGLQPWAPQRLPPTAQRTNRRFFKAFRNGWQAQRAELLAEYVVKTLHDVLWHLRIDDVQAERILDECQEKLKPDEWFAGASK